MKYLPFKFDPDKVFQEDRAFSIELNEEFKLQSIEHVYMFVHAIRSHFNLWL